MLLFTMFKLFIETWTISTIKLNKKNTSSMIYIKIYFKTAKKLCTLKLERNALNNKELSSECQGFGNSLSVLSTFPIFQVFHKGHRVIL